MCKRALLSNIFLILFCSAVTAEAMEHKHHKVITDSVCDKKDAAPSLSCAMAPSAMFDVKGRLWLTWVFGQHVYINYSEDKGKTYSSPIIVNRIAENIYARGENRPKIVITNNGNIYISWTQKLAKRFSGHIRFSRSVDGGKHFSDPITVNDHQVISGHRFEAMAVNQRGDIYLAWLDKRDFLAAKKAGQSYNGAAVYYAVSTDDGITFHRNKKIIDNSCQCCRVAMVVDNDQLPVVLWRHIFGDNVRDHALVKFDSRMEAGDIVRVSHDQWQIDACPHHGPDISITEDGVYHLVWFNNAPKRHGLFYANTSDQGKNISAAINFGDYKKQAAHPQVLSLRETVFLLWKEFNGKQATLLMKKSFDSGTTWSKEIVLAKTTGHSDHPLLINDGKTVYAAWHRRGQDYQLFPLEND